MEYSQIEKKWKVISPAHDEMYSSIQVAADISVRLLMGLDRNMKRCLILSMMNTEKLELANNLREHVSFEYFDQSNHIIITLNDDRFREQFNALIYSLYLSIRPVQTVKEAAILLSQTYNQWSEFFYEMIDSSLTEEDVRGLWGELYYLKQKIKDASSAEINRLLECWKGPYGKSHDFEFPDLHTEVKTRIAGVPFVKISSEFQLDKINNRPLVLHVISVENDEEGISTGQMARDVYAVIASGLADVSVFLRALLKAGLPWQQIDRYDDQKFKIISEEIYDCMREGFPGIRRSELPQEIYNVKYSLDLESLSGFMIHKTEY